MPERTPQAIAHDLLVAPLQQGSTQAEGGAIITFSGLLENSIDKCAHCNEDMQQRLYGQRNYGAIAQRFYTALTRLEKGIVTSTEVQDVRMTALAAMQGQQHFWQEEERKHWNKSRNPKLTQVGGHLHREAMSPLEVRKLKEAHGAEYHTALNVRQNIELPNRKASVSTLIDELADALDIRLIKPTADRSL